MKNLKNYFKIFKKSQAKEPHHNNILIKEKAAQKAEPPSIRFAQWQAQALQANQKAHTALSTIYSPYQAPPGVRGQLNGRASSQIVMDSALPSAPGLADWAGDNLSNQGVLKAALEDGLVFLGYPTLAEMANRPELRKPCHVIAREALREWISIQATGSDATGQAQDRVKEIAQELARLNVRSLLQKMAEQYAVPTPAQETPSRPLSLSENTEFEKIYKTYDSNAERLAILQKENPELFKRPKGVPKNWIIKAGKNKGKNAGVIWHEPQNTNNHVRIMPGNPKVPDVSRQQPYVKRNNNGIHKDKNGNSVAKHLPEAHIPYKEFDYDKTK